MVSPSDKRESALSELIGRLGNTQTQDQRYNNGYAHYSLAVHSSFIRSFEMRAHLIISNIEATIIDVTPLEQSERSYEHLIGKTISLHRPLFFDTMTMTKWIENFYQESPSINARAREDQVRIGEKAFGIPVMSTWQAAMEDELPESD